MRTGVIVLVSDDAKHGTFLPVGLDALDAARSILPFLKAGTILVIHADGSEDREGWRYKLPRNGRIFFPSRVYS